METADLMRTHGGRSTPTGVTLTVAGWFWIGYFVGIVLIVLEVWR